jgi:transcriptional regulator with XRE-family HTH domain
LKKGGNPMKFEKECPLTTFRKKLGMTRAEMARVTEIGYVTLSNIENGYVLSITKSVQNKLAAIGVPADLPDQYQAWRASFKNKISSSEETENQQQELPLS